MKSSTLAHLDDCSECATYIANVSVVTRSALPANNQLSPSAKIAAKFGRLDSNINIADSLNSDLIMNRSVEELRKINQSIEDEGLRTALAAIPIDSESLLKAISNSKHVIDNRANFFAAQSLHIANITARHAKANNNFEHVTRTLDEAIAAYASIQDKTVLQDNLLVKLQALQLSYQSNEPPKLDNTIDLVTQAMASLGA